MLGRGPSRALALLVLLVAVGFSGAAVAQDGAGGGSSPRALTGDLHVERDLRVERGDALVIGPGAHLRGTGRVLVYGNLTVAGTDAEPVVFEVPVFVFGSPSAAFAGARFEVPHGDSLFIAGGTVTVRDTVFDGRGRGDVAIAYQPAAWATLTLQNVTLRDFDELAMRVNGPGVVQVEDSRFEDNVVALGASLDGEGELAVRVARTAFARNEQHVRLNLRAGGTTPGSFEISESVLRDGTADPEGVAPQKAGFIVTERPTNASFDAPVFQIRSLANLYANNPSAVHLDGRTARSAYAFTSVGDRYEGNGVGFYAEIASAEIRDALFEANGVDVRVPYAPDAVSPLVRIVNSTYAIERIRVDPGAGAVDADGRLLRAAGVAVGAVGAASALALVLTDVGRQLLARGLLAPLYARLRPGDVLLNPTRRLILDYVTANPGAHMRRVGQALEISYGTLAYHLYRLERDKYISSREEGLFKRYFASAGGAKPKAAAGPNASQLRSVERDILNAIIASPGSAQSAIANQLGVSRQSLHYHIKKLEAQGFITKVPRGRETLVFAREEAVAAAREADGLAAGLTPEAAAAPGQADEAHPPIESAGGRVAAP